MEQHEFERYMRASPQRCQQLPSVGENVGSASTGTVGSGVASASVGVMVGKGCNGSMGFAVGRFVGILLGFLVGLVVDAAGLGPHTLNT
jgi:hypothetical protein